MVTKKSKILDKNFDTPRFKKNNKMNEIDVSDYANDHTDIEIRIENDFSKKLVPQKFFSEGCLII